MRQLLLGCLDKTGKHIQLITGILFISRTKHDVNNFLARPVIVLGGKRHNNAYPVEQSHTYLSIRGIIGAHKHELCRMHLTEPLTLDKNLAARNSVHNVRHRRAVEKTDGIDIEHSAMRL